MSPPAVGVGDFPGVHSVVFLPLPSRESLYRGAFLAIVGFGEQTSLCLLGWGFLEAVGLLDLP